MDQTRSSVLVLLGTDHHPFDRLLRWVEGWLADQGPGAPSVLVQHGFTVAPPRAHLRAQYVPFLDHLDLAERLSTASAVVCHGGPGTIADCRRAGLLPVVLPRSSALGEHVDDHQVLFTRRLHRDGLVRTVDSETGFAQELQAGLARPRTPLTDLDDSTVATTVATFGDLVAAAVQARHRRLVPWRARRRRLGDG